MSENKHTERGSSGKVKDKKKSSPPHESPRSLDGRPRDEQGCVSTGLNPHHGGRGGEITVVDPRQRDSVYVGRPDTVINQADWEERIARMVETALAWALPTALGAPALQSEPPSSVPTFQLGQQLAPLARMPGPDLPSIDVSIVDVVSLGIILLHILQVTSTKPKSDKFTLLACH